MNTLNYFEELGAPTSSSNDLLAQYAAARQKTRYQSGLLNLGNRLFHELTTVRAEKAANCNNTARYCSYFSGLTGSSAESIPCGYAGEWFDELLKFLPESSILDECVQIFKALDSSNPWLLQGLSACVLRVAINSETDHAGSLVRIWQLALALYRRFFSLEKVQNSHAYLLLENDEERNECIKNWNGFFIELIEEICKRIIGHSDHITGEVINGYLEDMNYEAVANCVAVLENCFEISVESEKKNAVFEKIINKFAEKIKMSISISVAEEYVKNFPYTLIQKDKGNTIMCAMVDAMTNESKNISLKTADIDKIEYWLNKYNLKDNYIFGTHENNDSSLIDYSLIKASEGFFSEVANQIRIILNTEDIFHPFDFYELVRCIDLLPFDFSVGKIIDKSDLTVLTAVQLITKLIVRILNYLSEADVESVSTIEDVKKFRHYQKKNERFFTTYTVDVSMTLYQASDIVYTGIFVKCLNTCYSNIDFSEIAKRIAESGKDITKMTEAEITAMVFQSHKMNETIGQRNARMLALTLAGFFPADKKIEEYTLSELFQRLNAKYPDDIIPIDADLNMYCKRSSSDEEADRIPAIESPQKPGWNGRLGRWLKTQKNDKQDK